MSCYEWIEDANKVEPVYDLHYALSTDGIHWELLDDNTCRTGSLIPYVVLI